MEIKKKGGKKTGRRSGGDFRHGRRKSMGRVRLKSNKQREEKDKRKGKVEELRATEDERLWREKG